MNTDNLTNASNYGLSQLFRAILFATMLSGTLDICAACLHAYIQFGFTPVRVLQFVASGIWGQSAYLSGSQGALAGLGVHYMIAYFWSVVFFFCYPYLLRFRPNISQNLVLTGCMYGAIVWLCMTFLILPQTNVVQRPLQALSASIGASILMCCIGMPLTWAARRFFRKNPDLLG